MKLTISIPNRVLGFVAGGALCFTAGTVIATEFPTTSEATHYSGLLTDAVGNPRTGNANLEVELFDAPTGGDRLCGTASTPTDLGATGRFRLSLPAACTDALRDHGDVHAQLTVDGTELPRQKLGATAYAAVARDALSADFAETIADGSVTEAKLAPGLATTVSGLASAFAVDDGVATALGLVQAEYEGTLETASIALVPVTVIHDSHGGLDAATDRYTFPYAGTYQISYHWFSSQVGSQCTIG